MAGHGLAGDTVVIKPGEVRQISVGFHQVPCTGIEQLVGVGAPCKIERQLLELLGIAFEVEAETLLQPKHIGDQGSALFFFFVVLQQPQQGDEQDDEQPHGQLRHRQIPA